MSDLRKGIFFVGLIILATGILMRRPAIWLTGFAGILGAIFMEGL
jgi:hypothetical protein